MVKKGKVRICISLPENVYNCLVACCKEGNLSKSRFVELSLNSCLNYELVKKK